MTVYLSRSALEASDTLRFHADRDCSNCPDDVVARTEVEARDLGGRPAECCIEHLLLDNPDAIEL